MRQRAWLHLGIIIAVGAVLRTLLFNVVGVWGDYGFYLYNAQLINEGQQPFVDFLARSPLFMYPLAWVIDALPHDIILVRAYVIVWWLLAAVPVYLIARRIGDHGMALGATAVYLLAPFGLAYGMWVNTLSMAAFFGLIGVYAVIRSNAAWSYGVAGVMIALAFLSRRSVVTLVAALAVAAAVEGYRSDRDWQRVAGRVVALAGTFAATLFVGYLAVMRGDIGNAIALYETHAVNLFITTGRGGYPLLSANPDPITNPLTSGRIPIFNDVCQLCGVWTARTLAKLVILWMPVWGLLLYYGRSIMDRSSDYVAWSYPIGILAVLGWYAAVKTLLAGQYSRVGVIVALVLFAIVAWFVDELPDGLVWSRESVIILVAVGGFFAGYLYRNRLLHAYYFMDIWPYVSILGGVLGVGMWRRADRPLRTMMAVAVALSLIGAFVAPNPASDATIHGNENKWYSISGLQEFQDDLNSRADKGDVVLTAQPSYPAVSHTKMINDNARAHYVYASYYPNGPAARMYHDINRSLRDGSIRWVIVDKSTQNMLDANASVEAAFESNYCRADNAGLYQQAGAYLYRWQPNCSDPPSVEWLQNATA